MPPPPLQVGSRLRRRRRPSCWHRRLPIVCAVPPLRAAVVLPSAAALPTASAPPISRTAASGPSLLRAARAGIGACAGPGRMLGTLAGWLPTVSLLCARRSADHEQPPAAALAPPLRVCVFCVLVLCGGGVGADEGRCATNNEYAVFDTAKRFANLHKHAHTLLHSEPSLQAMW